MLLWIRLYTVLYFHILFTKIVYLAGDADILYICIARKDFHFQILAGVPVTMVAPVFLFGETSARRCMSGLERSEAENARN